MTFEKSIACCEVDILKQENGKWSTNYTKASIDALCKIISDVPSSYFIFATARAIRDCDNCRGQLERHLTWPTFLGIDDGQISNGYTGFEDLFDDFANYQGHTSRTRFLIKRLLGHAGPDGKNYTWEALSFFSKWVSARRNVVVFFDIPSSIRQHFPLAVLQANDPLYFHDPYWIHVLAVQEIVSLQDDSVWSIRDAVRNTERLRDTTIDLNPNYPKLHDIARHAIHSHESLIIGETSVRSLINQHHRYLAEAPPTTREAKVAAKHLSSRLALQLHLIESLKHRAQSNKERLQNELNLAFNVVSQYDSRVSVQIGQAVQSDSTAMKTLAMLTMTFLPATFTSSIFSMAFFDYTPGNGGQPGRFVVSEKFWVFWIVAAPLTAMTMGVWLFWMRWYPVKAIGS